MNRKNLGGMDGLSVYKFGNGCEIHIGNAGREQFAFTLNKVMVEAMISNLQNPKDNPEGDVSTQPSGILSGR